MTDSSNPLSCSLPGLISQCYSCHLQWPLISCTRTLHIALVIFSYVLELLVKGDVRDSKGLSATTSIGLRWHPGGRFATAVNTLFARTPRPVTLHEFVVGSTNRSNISAIMNQASTSRRDLRHGGKILRPLLLSAASCCVWDVSYSESYQKLM